MTATKKLGIWMDNASAHLIEYADPFMTSIVVSASTRQEKERTLQKSENIMHNKEQHQQADYYKTLGESIKHYDEVLLFGPTNAKLELLNILKADHHFDKIKIETRQSGKMTGNQEQAFVKEYFLNIDGNLKG